ncbi:cytochrome C [Oryzomonas sagensis]|uniref:Cytochrome C n=1 Tax=Oryzomonas sagensis TaxID=2603857 RepID=A0ABQ6TL96_9BACT|nr:cytochrome C [Oryzomonas sagensis]
MSGRRFRCLALSVCLIWLVTGCDPVTRHKALTSILDGYPTLPPVEEICREHEERAKAVCLQQKTASVPLSPTAARGSEHNPYKEKLCNSCHKADKGGGSGGEDGLLIKPREYLCVTCHKDLLTKRFQHGPAAVGDCLACHLPHTSANPALLNTKKEALCVKCHTERRKAVRMHDLFVEKGITCDNCHDPHSGDSMYFLK